MTSPTTDNEKQSAADRAQTFLDWTSVNSRALTLGAAIVVVAAAGYWFVQRNSQLKAAAGERALSNAKQSIQAGNLQLAQSDLQSVYAKYGSTAAGVEAAMMLAQINYDAKKPQDGIKVLEKLAGSRAASSNLATIHDLEGDGYAQMGKLTDAAKHYEEGAAASPFEMEKAYLRAKAGRAYQAAGDTAASRKIWADLANDPKAQAMSSGQFMKSS